MEPNLGMYMIINTNVPQVVDPSPSSPKVTRPKKSTLGDLDFDHSPISQYLQRPRALIPEVLVGSKLVTMAASMNHLPPTIENSSTHQITGGKRPIVQKTIAFVSEHDYERPHTTDGILDIKGQQPPK